MRSVKVGFVTCVHPFYDLPAVVKHREAAVEALTQAGCEVVAAPIPRNSLDAIDIASLLRKSDVDAVLLFFCTWVAEDITLALARELMDVPMLIWALPYLDRDIPMPSPMSGFTASGSNIRRLGKSFAYMIGHVTPAKVEQARVREGGGRGQETAPGQVRHRGLSLPRNDGRRGRRSRFAEGAGRHRRSPRTGRASQGLPGGLRRGGSEAARRLIAETGGTRK